MSVVVDGRYRMSTNEIVKVLVVFEDEILYEFEDESYDRIYTRRIQFTSRWKEVPGGTDG